LFIAAPREARRLYYYPISGMLKAFGFGTPKCCSVLSVPVGVIPLPDQHLQVVAPAQTHGGAAHNIEIFNISA